MNWPEHKTESSIHWLDNGNHHVTGGNHSRCHKRWQQSCYCYPVALYRMACSHIYSWLIWCLPNLDILGVAQLPLIDKESRFHYNGNTGPTICVRYLTAEHRCVKPLSDWIHVFLLLAEYVGRMISSMMSSVVEYCFVQFSYLSRHWIWIDQVGLVRWCSCMQVEFIDTHCSVKQVMDRRWVRKVSPWLAEGM